MSQVESLPLGRIERYQRIRVTAGGSERLGPTRPASGRTEGSATRFGQGPAREGCPRSVFQVRVLPEATTSHDVVGPSPLSVRIESALTEVQAREQALAMHQDESTVADKRPSGSWRPRSAPRRRLIGDVVSYRAELNERIEEATHKRIEDAGFLSWSMACKDLLSVAWSEARFSSGNVGVGHQALSAARRMEILEFDSREVRAAAIELAEEAKSPKLKEWRREAVVRLLRFVWFSEELDRALLSKLAEDGDLHELLVLLLHSEPGSERMAKTAALLLERGLRSGGADAVAGELLHTIGEDPTGGGVRAVLAQLASTDLAAARVFLRRATLVRDEGLQNKYRKTDILKQNLWIVSAFLAPAIVGLLLLGWFLPLDLSGPTLAEGREVGGRILAYVSLFGVLGACLSAILSLIRTSRREGIPEIAAHGVTAVIRPLFGASAALVAFVLIASGLQEFVSTSNAAVLFMSFAAGFSERLIVRAVAAVAAGEEGSAPSSVSGG